MRPHGVRPSDPLEVLYDEHAPALFRFLVRLTGDEAAVKDILQEIFIRLAREPLAAEPPAQLRDARGTAR